jgi:hypothetical protein
VRVLTRKPVLYLRCKRITKGDIEHDDGSLREGILEMVHYEVVVIN